MDGGVNFSRGEVLVTPASQRRLQHWFSAFQWVGQPRNIAPFHCRSVPPPTSHPWFLGLTRVNSDIGISIGSAVFSRLTNVTNRQTDRPRYSICSNRPHLAIAAMQLSSNT